jgi:hypothetical protein
MQLTNEQTRPGYYNAAGKKIPSVTTISKLIQASEGLIHWAWDLGCQGQDYRTVRDQAATAGHAAHSMIECAITGRPFMADPAVDEATMALARQGFGGFQSWIADTKFELVQSEVRIISEEHQYGGRLDCIAKIKDELCIFDWKTSKGRRVQESWLPQVAAYRQGWNETHPYQRIKGCHIMVLAKEDAGFSHHYFPESSMDVGWQAFLACQALYEARKKIGKLI